MTSIDSQQLPDAMDVSATLPAPRLKDFADAVIDPGQVTDAIQVLVGAYTGKAVDDRIILYFNGDNHSTFAYLMVHSGNLGQDIAFTIAKTPYIDGNSRVDMHYIVQRADGSSDSSEVLPATIQDKGHLVREFVDFEDLEPHGWVSNNANWTRIELYGGSYVMSMGAPNGSTIINGSIVKTFSNLKVGSTYRLTAKFAATGRGSSRFARAWIMPAGGGRIGIFDHLPISATLTTGSGVFVAPSVFTIYLIVEDTVSEVLRGYYDDILLELIE